MSRKRYPGYRDVGYPAVFNTIPPQPPQLKPGQLTEQQVRQFFDEGFLAIDSFFDESELNPAKDAIDVLVDNLANKLYKAGKIQNLYSEHGFKDRLAMLDKEFPGTNIILHKIGHLPQAFRDVWGNERLLNLAEQLLGTGDIVGNPNWNLRCQTPNTEAATVTWHQDSGYADVDTYKVFHLTCWIPLVDTDETSGCMQMVRYGHKTGRVGVHTGCDGDTWYLMLGEDEIKNTLGCDLDKDVVTCPVKYGGLLIFSNVMPHRSLNNTTDHIRWSLDLRYQPAGSPTGFYGLKDGVRMRSSTDPDFKIDWETFDAVSRHDTHKQEADELDPTICGPWMLKWEIVHHNRHTAALASEGQAAWGKAVFG